MSPNNVSWAAVVQRNPLYINDSRENNTLIDNNTSALQSTTDGIKLVSGREYARSNEYFENHVQPYFANCSSIAPQSLSSKKVNAVGRSYRKYEYVPKEQEPIEVQQVSSFQKAPREPLQEYYSNLMRTCKNRDFTRALILLKEMERKGIQPNLDCYESIIYMYLQDGDPGIALTLLKNIWLAGIGPSVGIYNALIEFFACNENLMPGALLLEEMWETGIVPNITTYNIMLKAYVKYGTVKEVKAFLEKMHLDPNIDTAQLLMSFCQKNALMEEFRLFFEKMKQDGIIQPETFDILSRAVAENGVDENDDEVGPIGMGINPTLENYTALMDFYVIKGYGEGCQALMREMQHREIKPDITIYELLLKHYRKTCDLKAAKALCEEMEWEGVKLNLNAYTTLIQLYLKIGEVNGAIVLWNEMVRSGIEPDEVAYGVWLKYRLTNGNKEICLKLQVEMRQKGILTALTHSIYMKHFFQNGDFFACDRRWDKMLADKVQPTTKAYNIQIQRQLKSNASDSARKLLRDMKFNPHSQPDAVTELLMLMNCIENENMTLDEAFKALQIGFKPTTKIYNALMKLDLKSGDDKIANLLLQEMLKNPHTKPDANSYAIFMKYFLKRGRLDMISLCRQEMERMGIKSNALVDNIMTQILQPKIDRLKNLYA